ncbi:hypothetical protein GLOIN_2v1797848 [Rhizophagus irregularis DAOM 181602=DAOM 197198]|nr:hypothetical protein GLOIN_2v1797848 [Rhizophagus irregularis DAOM 181602=DAOM 197198]
MYLIPLDSSHQDESNGKPPHQDESNGELEIILQLNRQPFIIRIVHHVHSLLQPSYICEGKGQSSGIIESASKAITSVY